jgi:branched-chain amino acid transport system substrate-binding protein
MAAKATRWLSLAAVISTAAALAACGTNSSAKSGLNGGEGGSHAPIVIGASLPLTGGFSVDGQAFKRGYQLWASIVNRHGGLLGRQVRLDILNDASSPTTAASDYAKLIVFDHVSLVFGPFSTLLTVPSAEVAARHRYAFIEGAGGGPAVFQLGLHNLFDVSPPIADQLVPLAKWAASLPPGQRPKTAAYPMVRDPFADPMVLTAQGILQQAGIKTVYSRIYPPGDLNYLADAGAVAATGAQLVVLGTVDVPSVSAFIIAFEHQHYVPRILAASSGPDQGAMFLKAIGGSRNAAGIMVPDGWYGGEQNPLSRAMVKAYLAKYGGTASSINADVAEAYSVGETAADAINATHSVSNAKIISWLHSGVTVQTVQGASRFNSVGENVGSNVFIFQWQHGARFVQVLPARAPGTVPIVISKPAWGTG